MMHDLPPEALAQVRSLDLKSYLLAHGWQRFPGRRADVGIFRHAGSPEAEVLLPFSLDFADLEQGLARAVAEIARFERRPAAAVLRDLLRPRADILRFAVEGHATDDGGIGLDEGLALLSGSRKALLAAACSAERPQRFHRRMSLREAEAFVRRCRLGQTEHGSFVATVECALDVDDAALRAPLPGDTAPEPFGRKATVLLMRSVARVIDAIRADDLAGLGAPPEGAPVVSANLCEAIVEMMPAAEGAALRIASSWSPVLPAPPAVPAIVRVESQYRGAIEEVARALRPSASPSPSQFVGRVDALLGEPGDDGTMRGEIVLAAPVEDEIVKVRVDLGPEDYARAWHAHFHNEYISVRGILRRGARAHRLDQAADFAVVRG